MIDFRSKLWAAVEMHASAVLLGLAAVVFGVFFLFALLSGSILFGLIISAVFFAILNALRDYRQRMIEQRFFEAVQTDTKAAMPPRIARGPRRVPRLRERLKQLPELRKKRFEIIRVRQVEPTEGPHLGQRVLAVTVEVAGRREYVQLAGCVLTYYAATLVFWATWFGLHPGQGDASQLGWVSFGFSILVLPAALIALALKFSWATVLAGTLLVMGAHLMLLHNPEANPNSQTVVLAREHAVSVLSAWVVGVVAVIGAERVLAHLLGMHETVVLAPSKDPASGTQAQARAPQRSS